MVSSIQWKVYAHKTFVGSMATEKEK